MVVLLALCSAFLFGAMTVALRVALRRGDAPAGTAATVLVALAVALLATAARGAAHGLDFHGSWPFFLAGIAAPGASQILFTLAVREAGPSRTSVAVGAAPLVAVVIALVLLHEPVRVPLVAGAVLVVFGGVALASERDRPEHVRVVGLLFAVGACALFASRDNLVRWLSTGAAPPPEVAAAATLLAGALVALAWVRRLPNRRELLAFAPPGLCFGVSYVLLFEAYYRGRVSVVSPLVASESLWGVVLAAAFLRHDRVGARIVAGATLIVAGGALIGAFR